MTESETSELTSVQEASDDKEETPSPFEEKPATDRRGLGLIPVLGLSLVAALLGAVGGAYGTHYLFPPANMEDLRASVQQDVSRIQAETQAAVEDLRQMVASLEGQVSDASSDTNIEETLNAINERLQTLENAPEPNLPEIAPETLSALKAAQRDGFNWPETDAVENDVLDLTSKTESLEAQIDRLKAQINSLQTELNAQASRPQVPQTETETVTPAGPEFPKQALLNAAKLRVDSQGFLSRTLNKHVSVDSPDSPKSLIEKIDTAYDKGDIYTAIKTFDHLPSDIRSAGQDWRDAAERLQ
ncbi:hypothetical protein [Litorimonas haliclonae]|uniref:hypothetical protein n=1 Tax=Litorimonas haliclonae TaxID=2081977 RepID=UPI0039EE5C91